MILELYATMAVAGVWLSTSAPLDILLLFPLAAYFVLSNELPAQ